ncbi:MAG: YicC/YloC family endoribonuclease [Candidatus Omnitrophota bacterium]
MIKGMTGYGTAQVNAGQIKGVIEVKSVNHRYLDLAFYLPLGFGAAENEIRQVIAQKVQRGRITVSFKITDKPEPKIVLNRGAVKQYLNYAHMLKKEFNLENNISVSDIIKLPGVSEAHDVFVSPEKIWPALERALFRAVNGLHSMRQREGRALARDINSLLTRMLKMVKKIQTRALTVLKEKKRFMTIEEFSSYQKSIDINEEMARLVHYIDEFRTLLKSPSGVGKKMDFIGQEMQRETNTIGSKLQDKIVSNCVIAIKSKIEKLREQAQNIE